MKIKSLGKNITEIELNPNRKVLVSYETPVAAIIPANGINNTIYSVAVRTDIKHSVTTERHINKWLSDNGYDPNLASELRQEYFDHLLD